MSKASGADPATGSGPKSAAKGKGKHLSFANQLLSPTRLQYKRPKAGFNLWNHLSREMFGWGEPGSLKPPGKENIVNFLYVPYQLECFLLLGLLMCLDAFLYIFTFLPLRVVLGVCSLLQELPVYTLRLLGGADVAEAYALRLFPRFHRTQGFDLMRAAMLCIGVAALQRINMSQAYHFVRGQSVIKLYVLMGMMEVLDKLLCSFGQDVFDALHNATRRAPTSRYTLFYFAISVGYVLVHAVFYFYQVATYMVVVNSADEALVTVLILNNFSELRGFVFKKFDANNLFQCACSDVSERFQIVLFLGVIFLVTLAQQTTPSSTLFSMLCIAASAFSSAISGHTFHVAPSAIATTLLGAAAGEAMLATDPQLDSPQHALFATLQSMTRCMVLMVAGESLSDCVKHAFMNKFNAINASVYEDFAYVLRADLLNFQCDTIVLDHTYSVTRRLGLAQIPLAAVTLRYVLLAVSRVTVVVDAAHATSGAQPLPPPPCRRRRCDVRRRPAPARGSSRSGRRRCGGSASGRRPTCAARASGSSGPSLWLALVVAKVALGVALVVYADDRQRRDAQFVYQRTPLEVDRLKAATATPKAAATMAAPSVDDASAAPRASSLFASVSRDADDADDDDDADAAPPAKQLFVEPDAVTAAAAASAEEMRLRTPPRSAASSTQASPTKATAAAIDASRLSPELAAAASFDNDASLATAPLDDRSASTATAAATDDGAAPVDDASPRSQRTRERIDFLEKLATMERYTIYNGRII
eukprot:gene2567-1864_t